MAALSILQVSGAALPGKTAYSAKISSVEVTSALGTSMHVFRIDAADITGHVLSGTLGWNGIAIPDVAVPDRKLKYLIPPCPDCVAVHRTLNHVCIDPANQCQCCQDSLAKCIGEHFGL